MVNMFKMILKHSIIVYCFTQVDLQCGRFKLYQLSSKLFFRSLKLLGLCLPALVDK